jgi:predicted transglutaminase-like cysteine proteinase
MRIISSARAWRAVMLLVGAVLLAPTPLMAGTLELHQLASAPNLRFEPFGSATRIVAQGGLYDKWRGVQARLDDEQRRIAACRDDRAHCVDKAAGIFLNIVEAARDRDGLARLGAVNRAVNLAIRPMSDLANYGEVDVWSSPLATLANGSGDCEDYAIAKMAALKAAGVPSADLRLVILRETSRDEDHAVLAVRLGPRWIVLDNRMLVMLSDTQIANYRPVYVADDAGVRAYGTDAPPPAPMLPYPQGSYPQDVAYLISAQAGVAS